MTALSKEQLKPCPFCGSPAAISRASNDARWWIITCTDQADDASQACPVRPEVQDDNRAMAIVHWNHREPAATRKQADALLSGEIDALENAAREVQEDYPGMAQTLRAIASRSPAPAVAWVDDTWRIRQQEASRVLQSAGWSATAISELFEPYAAPAREKV